jgi:hypothetical protein
VRGGVVGDIVQIAPGAAPWKPTPDSTLQAEYQYYDVPTLGITRQHGVDHLFQCILDLDPVSYWAYTHVTEDERQHLEDAIDADAFTKTLDSIVCDRAAVLAMAMADVGVLAARPVQDLFEVTVDEAMTELAHDLGSTLRRSHTPEADVEVRDKSGGVLYRIEAKVKRTTSGLFGSRRK